MPNGKHQNLDAGGDHIAEHPLGKKRRLIEQTKGDEHKASDRGELEFNERNEQLNR
jgi:hypothetical protein